MIILNGKEYRTLDDKFYVNGKKVKEAYVNGTQVYPMVVEGTFDLVFRNKAGIILKDANVFIDWGDGTSTSFQGSTTLFHEYGDRSNHTVSIAGDYSYISFDGTRTKCQNNLRKVLSQIPYSAGKRLVDTSYMFHVCYYLTTIPANLFEHCTETTTFFRTFGGCQNLYSPPEGLFDHCTKVTSFRQTFEDCKYNLKKIPANLFDNCPLVTNFQGCFLVDYQLSGTVPELWKKYPGAQGESCFHGDTKISNYGSIPAVWRNYYYLP